jgi:hypothetical protein
MRQLRSHSQARNRPRAGSPDIQFGYALEPSRGDALESIRKWTLIFLLAWAPLPFGSARPWAWDLLGIVAMMLLLLSTIQELSKPSRRGVWAPLAPALVMGSVVAGWIVFQSLPWDVFGWHHPLWDRGGEMLGHRLDGSLSIDREASFVHLFRLLTYAAYFIIVWQAARRPDGAEAILRAIAAVGAIYAIYGLIEFVSPEPRILWFVKDAYITDVTSTFINRNSYATFAGLSVIANLVLVAKVLIKNTDPSSRISLVLSMIDTLFGRARWWMLGLVLTSASLLMSHSRAGLAATMSGVLALTVLILMAPSARAPWRLWFGGFVAAGCVAILALTGASTFERFDTMASDAEMRPSINAALFRAIRDNIWGGTGLGSFAHIFPLYQPLSIVGFVDLAHNDYLENMLELGVPAALLLFGIVFYLGVRCVLGVFRRRRDVIYPCAGAAATALIGIHSAFDFSMQIPAVAVTYAVMLGVGVAQSVNSRDVA